MHEANIYIWRPFMKDKDATHPELKVNEAAAISMKEMKDLLNIESSPQAAARRFAGTTFWCQNTRGQRVLAVILPELECNQVQARVECLDGCGVTHARKRSDWHHSLRCRCCAPPWKELVANPEDLPDPNAPAPLGTRLDILEVKTRTHEDHLAVLEAEVERLKKKVAEQDELLLMNKILYGH